MHRQHHAFSDTEKDPHSPHFFKDAFQMMVATAVTFRDHLNRIKAPDACFEGYFPGWRLIDRLGSPIASRIIFGLGYLAFYVAFADHSLLFLLLPLQFAMGPIHGAIVNWCGHKYGYTDYDNGDRSKNTSPLDLLMLGELSRITITSIPTAPISKNAGSSSIRYIR